MRLDTSAPARIESRAGVIVLDGYGISVSVRRGQLALSDGIGTTRREGRFSKATGNLRRLVIVGHTGAISLEAIRWLHDGGASLIQIDRDATVLFASSRRGRDDARLRRAQAIAPYSATGLEVSRELLVAKLAGQFDVVLTLPESGEASDRIGVAVRSAREAGTLDELLRAESDGATAYWGAWSALVVRFPKRLLSYLPEHWLTFGQRSSPFSGSPRRAANPTNALLNYLYAILEAETSIACAAVGLDPGLGFFHLDTASRDSLACDVMEAIRPKVDAYVLKLLSSHTFSPKDFYEDRKGVCRVLAPLTHELSETARVWQLAVAPIAERVAQMLADSVRQDGPALATPLTQSRRRASQGLPRVRVAKPTGGKLRGVCEACGETVPNADRRHCDACDAKRIAEQGAALVLLGPQALQRMREEGRDPAHGGAPSQKRSATARMRRIAEIDWDRTHDLADPEEFTLGILPKLADCSLRELSKATGLSLRYCSLIRRGERVPHARHWAAFNSFA